MMQIDLAFSTCPNDTFIFHALLHNLVDIQTMAFEPHLHDVEALNQMAFEQTFHVTKLSLYAYLKLRKFYTRLDSGAALGYGCGPLLVARTDAPITPQTRIAIPGEHTTAYLLMQLWNSRLKNIEVTRFDNILAGVKTGKYDAGLIIHEGRFVYRQYNCVEIVDLGAWWEAETGMPIPLGCIALLKRPPYNELKDSITRAIRMSTEYALANRQASRKYIQSHAQEMEDAVIDGHIDLYVNDFTLSLSDTGTRAIDTLESMAQRKKIL